MKQTAVEWLIEQIINDHNKNALTRLEWMKVFEQAKEMEYKQNMDAMQRGMELQNKESNRIGFRERNGFISSKIEISDESWEGCDGCTEQDEVMYKNGYVKGYNAAISELPKEISDEEIEKGAEENTCYMNDFILGAKWYREKINQGNNLLLTYGTAE